MLYIIQSGISELLCSELDDNFWIMVDVKGHWTVLPVQAGLPGPGSTQ